MSEQTIHGALIKAMSEVTKVQKSSRNVDQKYDFASIDDFLAMAGPICAANGLYTVMDEADVAEFERQGKYGATHWLRVRFCLTTYHESGASLPPVYRTVEVIRTGAQSFGSAQSYALKQYLRALLLIPTGDKDDADFAEKGEGMPSPVHQGNKASPPRQPQQQAKPPADDEVAWFRDHLPGMTSPDHLNAVLTRAKAAGRDVAKMVADRANALNFDFDPEARRYVKAPSMGEIIGDELPY